MVGAVLLLVVLWGPTPAFRNIWWILVFAVLLALGVTMLRRETAREFPEYRSTARPCMTTKPNEPTLVPARPRPHLPQESRPSARPRRRPRLSRVWGGSRRSSGSPRSADSGAITNDEYQAEKTHVMSNGN